MSKEAAPRDAQGLISSHITWRLNRQDIAVERAAEQSGRRNGGPNIYTGWDICQGHLSSLCSIIRSPKR